ncbi:alpha/beta fold hydrolase, partial [Legionella geestiana]|uniref:alpha/beta fold hydrolase n=1 Tax=Legionella geestiana TaxID=45065 RepID=UPI00138F22E4
MKHYFFLFRLLFLLGIPAIAHAVPRWLTLPPTPTPKGYNTLFDKLSNMSATQPNFTKEQLKKITVPVWIVDGDHDEVVKRGNTEFMAAQIINSRLLIQASVSHFSFLQDSKQFNNDVLCTGQKIISTPRSVPRCSRRP